MLQVGDIIIGKNCILNGIYYPSHEKIKDEYIKELICNYMLIVNILEGEMFVIYLHSNEKEKFKYNKEQNFISKEFIRNDYIYFDYEIISDK
jgi:hypothetical protein